MPWWHFTLGTLGNIQQVLEADRAISGAAAGVSVRHTE